MARDENMIAALKRERAGYVARGDTDRVAQVDEELTKYGYDGVQDADPNAPVEPKGRTASPGRQTTAQRADTGAEDKPDDKTGKAATARRPPAKDGA